MAKRRRIERVNNLFLITVIFYGLVSGIVGYIWQEDLGYYGGIILSQALLVLPGIVYKLKYNLSLNDDLRFRPLKGSNLILIILFSLAVYPLLTMINAVSMMFSSNYIAPVAEHMIENYPLWVNILVIAVVPCIAEEFVYRGIFYREYRGSGILKAAFLSSLLFGILHLNWNQFFYAVIMGIIFAALVEITDSIYASMVSHLTINLYSLLLASWSQKGEATTKITDLVNTISAFGEVYAMILYVVIPSVIAWVIWKRLQFLNQSRETEAESKTETWRSYITFPLVLAMLICFTAMLL